MTGLDDQFLRSIVPIFVAIDALGTLPIVISISEQMTKDERTRTVNLAMITASTLGLAFLFAGKYLLEFLDISVGHFAIAGGLVLLGLSMRDLVAGKMTDMPLREEMVAVVPIGTPLTVGPATLTTLLLLSGQYHLWIVVMAFAVNLAAAWLIFLQANRVIGFLGHGGVRAISKVASLLLAAIAVRMVIKGLTIAFPQLA
ncbi:MAG: MarC family protein [Chloroflexi bacterium]|nr:MarC family protein [Chloroflexota bacterium]